MDQAPELVSSFGSIGQGPGQFTYVTDVGILKAADGKSVERLYVSEYGGNDRISVFDGADHKFLFAFGAYGSSADAASVQFSRPQSVEVDEARRLLVVTDACNHRIGVFGLDGKLIRWIGSPETAGGGPDQFAYPYGLVLLGDGTALCTEFGNHRVHHVDYVRGKALEVLGMPGRGRGQFTNPWAITVMGDLVYVLDSGSDRIQAFKLSEVKKEVSTAGIEDANLQVAGVAR
jgi:DNA-binding beta-propeller fold protein YncE